VEFYGYRIGASSQMKDECDEKDNNSNVIARYVGNCLASDLAGNTTCDESTYFL
jgi:hypothetical protein